MLFVLSATLIKMLKPLAVFAAVLFATTAFAGILVAPAAAAADPQLEAIIAGRLKLQAQVQRCHVEVSWTERPEKNVEELTAAVSQEGPFKGSPPPSMQQFLKDGDRWQFSSCQGGATIQDPFAEKEENRKTADTTSQSTGCMNVLSDGTGIYGTSFNASVFNLDVTGPIANMSRERCRPTGWDACIYGESIGSVGHPCDPLLDACTAAVAGTRTDLTAEQVTVDGRPLVEVSFTNSTYHVRRVVLLDPARDYATVSESRSAPDGSFNFWRVVDWFPDKSFPRHVVHFRAMGNSTALKSGESPVRSSHNFYVTRADLNTVPDFRANPLLAVAGTQYTAMFKDPTTEQPIYKSDAFETRRGVTIDEWRKVYQSLVEMNNSAAAAATAGPGRPTKPGTSFAVWGLLAAGVACILAAIWTLRARYR